MYIKKLHIHYFRGFTKLTIDFQSTLAIILGANGVGKTSLLKCIAILLSQFLERGLKVTSSHSQSNNFSVIPEDINVKADYTDITTDITIEAFVENQTLIWGIK